MNSNNYSNQKQGKIFPISLSDIKLIEIDEPVCPYCTENLIHKEMRYVQYYDDAKTTITALPYLAIQYCQSCKKNFIRSECLENINLSCTNLSFKMMPLRIMKPYSKCIRCGEETYGDTMYCWEHYKQYKMNY